MHVGAAPVDRAAGYPALPDLRHDRDDGAAWRRAELLRALRRRRHLPDPGRRRIALDVALAAGRRRDLRAVRAVPAEGNLGRAARPPAVDTGAAMSTELLRAEGIGRRFGGFVALEGITVSFAAGQLTSIIGPNGAGKSTFFNILSGALSPSTGMLRFKGRELNGL